MKSNLYDTFENVWSKVLSYQDIFITTHERADGDGVGSMMALSSVFEKMGKHVDRFIVDGMPDALRFLAPFSDIKSQHVFKRPTLVFVLDASDPGRTHFDHQILAAKSQGLVEVVSIDHHTQGDYIPGFQLIDETASSTAELVYYFLTYSGVEIDMHTASCLLTGVFSDTGSFQHSNTSPRVLGIASDLLAKGARLHKISKQIYSSKSVPSLRIWGKALSRLKIMDEYGLAVSFLTQNDLKSYEATLDDAAGVVSIINTIPGIRIALLLVETEDGKIKGSLRSEEGRDADVARIARMFGGGGHRLAAGFTVSGKIVHERGKWKIV